MAMVMGISDQVVAMDFGRKIAEGTPEEVQQRPAGHRGLPGDDGVTRPSSRSPGLHAGYGPVEVLHGIDLTVGDGRDRRDPRRQRRRQDDDACGPISGIIARRGSVALRRPRHHRAQRPTRSSTPGIAQVPQGRGTFVDLTRRGQPARRRLHPQGRRDRRDIDRWFEVFPRLARAAHAEGRQPLGRRAADARHRPGAHEPADAAALRRAQPRPRPDHRAGDVRHPRRGSTRRRGCRCCSSSRTPTSPWTIADRAYLLETGTHRRVRATPTTIRDDDAIRKAYLGY